MTLTEITHVGVYSERKRDFVPTEAHRVVCPECGATGNSDAMWWEEVILNEPHLQCECGEQFFVSEVTA